MDPAIPSPTDEITSLRDRVSELDHQLATAEQENARLQTQHANLSASFAQVQRELAEISASTKFVAAAKDAVDTELAEEKQKREAAEELVEVLRGKVDDARKAFGTLQKQDKRASTVLAAGDVPGLDALGISSLDDAPVHSARKTSKRTSILFGNARRSSNASDHDPNSHQMLLSPPHITSGTTPTLPQAPVNAKGLRELRLSSTGGAGAGLGTPGAPPSPSAAAGSATLDPIPDGTTSTNRWSGLNFGARTSPARPPNRELREDAPLDPDDDAARRPSPAHRISSSSAQAGVDLTRSPPVADDRADALVAEIATLRAQLEEAREARVASEECLKALREFIAGTTTSHTAATTDGETGLAGIKLPPLPTDRDAEADEETQRTPQQEKKQGASGWSLGLWRAAPVPAPQSITTSTRSEAGDIPSAVQSPEMQYDQQLPIVPYEQDAQNPLRNFVSSWSNAVPAGTPRIETPPAAAGGKKAFSFFARSSSDRDVSVAQEEAFVPRDVSRVEGAGSKHDG